MSKYTDAEQFFKEHDHDGCLENCMENTDMSCDYCDKQRETICEALQIADRLEHITLPILWNPEPRYIQGFLDGWYKAIETIRGDNND